MRRGVMRKEAIESFNERACSLGEHPKKKSL
jgi:hypothetical protein